MKSYSLDDIAEFERTARATHISPPRGRVDVAIDFSSQIYGFSGHKTNEPAIYDCEKYSIWSDLPSVPTDPHKLREKTDFYNAKHIYVMFHGDSQTHLLEDLAYIWFMAPERVWNDLISGDFLEQVFITHTIRRLQKHATEFEPWKDLLRKYHSEDELLLNRFLEILEPKISISCQRLAGRWNGLVDQAEIYSRALLLTKALVFGDDKKIIGEVMETYASNTQNRKSTLRSLNREMRVHPFSTSSKFKTSSVKETYQENVSYLNNLLVSSLQNNSPAAETLLLLLINKDAKSSWLTGSLNNNSERIYSPSSNVSVLDHLFGKRGTSNALLLRYLKDSFRTEKNRAKRGVKFDDNQNYEDRTVRAVRWKKNDIANYPPDQINLLREKSELFLKGKLLDVYRQHLSGALDFTSTTMRKRFSRARKELAKHIPYSPS